MNNLLHEYLDALFEVLMSGIMNDLPVSHHVVGVQDGVNSEDWHDLLALFITDYVLSKIKQSIFDRLFQ